MPTENRSSNTEMVSFPRELSDDLAELIATRARVCGGGAYEIWEAICKGFGKPAEKCQGEPVEPDERTAFERAVLAEWPQAPLSRKRDLLPKDDPCYGDYCDEPLQRCWVGWRMRAWLEGSKPTALSRCVLCTQLQGELTARDGQIDTLIAGLTRITKETRLGEPAFAIACEVLGELNAEVCTVGRQP